MLEQHVVNRIDDAIANGWIKVYYQPVIRTLTGELCGFESLARWIDPEYGFLSPAQFVTSLEEAELIYKLDIFMIEKVCSDIHDRLTADLDMVPVSINFSRLDFLTCDMLEVLENAVNKYDIPRDYIHVEITESMMITDGDFMQEVIEGFREKGFAVWMDDFGSGYSSLNLLKDFNVDVIKLDMKFLSSMNVKSKAIVKSLITMAKDIGIKTLAEGVETEEEKDFLHEIGCGRLQGYFYGKPLPLEEAFANISGKGIKTEARKWTAFYDSAEYHVRSTDAPLELIVYDGSDFKTLFMNDAYKLQIFDELPSNKEADGKIYMPGSPLLTQYRSFAELLARSKKQEEFYYTAGGHYLRLLAREVAENEGSHLIKASIYNISASKEKEKTEELDYRLRELSHLFVVVLLFCPEEQRVTPILGKFRLFQGPEKMDMHKSTEMMANRTLHPNDRARYIEFMDFSTFGERVKKSPVGFIEEAFRFKDEEGTFHWVTATILMQPGSNGKEFLYCIKPLSDVSSKTILEKGASVGDILKPDEYSLLWYNILWGSNIKFFWKDKDRRYLGASKSFLDYFRLDSADEIIGKRGEDMKWHLAEGSYSDDEDDVLNHGSSSFVRPCQCIIDGVAHNTITSKLPIYRDGEIVGIMGYLIDVDETKKTLGEISVNHDVDDVTGVMNAYSFSKAIVDYSSQYHSLNKDYGLILLKNTKSERILKSYGKAFSDSVLQRIVDEIVDELGDKGVVARANETDLAVLIYADSREELKATAEKLKELIESIRCVDDKSITIKIAYSYRLRSEEGMTDEHMYVDALDELRGN
ncbi:MAG: EAL domain-containing protein [Saccharofermentans sp.]|nr:EAL domain-containing protein [Saccharofermentans sp.]